MSDFVNIMRAIESEIEHSRRTEDAFLRAICLFETHYQKRCSSLSEIFPDLVGKTITDAEAAEMRQILIRFIEELPSHSGVTAAIRLLALSGEHELKGFFITQLRLYLGWRNPTVVFQLLLALEDLREKVFYTPDGRFIGSRSAHDTETNFEVAQRYLKSH